MRNVRESDSMLSSAQKRDLTQQDGWKAEDGRITKKCHARPGMHNVAQHFFVILPSWVFQSFCCVRSLKSVRLSLSQFWRQLDHATVNYFLLFPSKTPLAVKFTTATTVTRVILRREEDEKGFEISGGFRPWAKGGGVGFFEVLKQNWFANIACPAGFSSFLTFFLPK